MNNTECIRGIQDCKAADIAKTVATMIRNNTGHLAQHQRVTEQAHRPIQASLSPGDESASVFPFAVFSSRSKCYRRRPWRNSRGKEGNCMNAPRSSSNAVDRVDDSGSDPRVH